MSSVGPTVPSGRPPTPERPCAVIDVIDRTYTGLEIAGHLQDQDRRMAFEGPGQHPRAFEAKPDPVVLYRGED